MIWSNIKVLQFFNEIFFWSLIRRPYIPGKLFGPCLAHYESFMQEWNIVIFRLWFGVMFWVRKNYTVTSCIFSMWIVKSLQLYGGRQITNPRKYCLVIYIYIYIDTHTSECIYDIRGLDINLRYHTYIRMCQLVEL